MELILIAILVGMVLSGVIIGLDKNDEGYFKED